MRDLILDQFDVNLLSIKKNTESFDFQIDDKFFESFDQDIVKKGKLDVHLDLSKTDLMITMNFSISGVINLICDKSLEEFEENLHSDHTIYFKFGDSDLELDINLFQIVSNTININVATHILEFILVQIPFRKIHPKLRAEDELEEEGKLLYQTDIDQNTEEAPDPRWKGLEELKNKFKNK